MSNACERHTLARRLTVALAFIAAASAVASSTRAQDRKQTVVQIEVGDSIGLPLPDAKVEVFTFMDGGVFWEWIPVDSVALPAGMPDVEHVATAAAGLPRQHAGLIQRVDEGQILPERMDHFDRGLHVRAPARVVPEAGPRVDQPPP